VSDDGTEVLIVQLESSGRLLNMQLLNDYGDLMWHSRIRRPYPVSRLSWSGDLRIGVVSFEPNGAGLSELLQVKAGKLSSRRVMGRGWVEVAPDGGSQVLVVDRGSEILVKPFDSTRPSNRQGWVATLPPPATNVLLSQSRIVVCSTSSNSNDSDISASHYVTEIRSVDALSGDLSQPIIAKTLAAPSLSLSPNGRKLLLASFGMGDRARIYDLSSRRAQVLGPAAGYCILATGSQVAEFSQSGRFRFREVEDPR
jgi:hypothetical protein